jgi:hypothetical protein
MRKIKKLYRTSFLFPRNSFKTGMGSTFNLFGRYYSFNHSKNEQEADYKAIQSDWGVIGQDIKETVEKHPHS